MNARATQLEKESGVGAETDMLEEDNRISLRTCDMRFPVIITSSVSKRVCGGSTSSCHNTMKQHHEHVHRISRASRNGSTAVMSSEGDVLRGSATGATMTTTSTTATISTWTSAHAADTRHTGAKLPWGSDAVRPSLKERERQIFLSAWQESNMWPPAHATRTNRRCAHTPPPCPEVVPVRLFHDGQRTQQPRHLQQSCEESDAHTASGSVGLTMPCASGKAGGSHHRVAVLAHGLASSATSPIISCEDVYHTVGWIHRMNGHGGWRMRRGRRVEMRRLAATPRVWVATPHTACRRVDGTDSDTHRTGVEAQRMSRSSSPSLL